MKEMTISNNSLAIQNELDWFQKYLTLRTKITFERSATEETLDSHQPPSLDDNTTAYAKFLRKHKLGSEERILLILALIPHIKPSMLDILYLKNALYDIPFTEFGGVRNEKHKGFLPTGETAMFLLAGDDIDKRLGYLHLFQKEHHLQKNGILRLQESGNQEPMLQRVLSISLEFIPELLTGKVFKPDFGPNFPAKRIYTAQSLEDLVVNDDVIMRINEIKAYLDHGKLLKNDYDFGNKIQPGFKVLFAGPPGTGKTLTASLLGKTCKRDVYKVDLSMVVSKYIGETEKNLSRVFDQAESKDWILFFDEADALFGKRSNTSDARYRYANQEVSFLLQRMESFDGLVILCTNFKKNIDDAFSRRFQLVVDFQLPTAQQRYALWDKAITEDFQYEESIDIDHLAETHELSAASIVNVLHYSILKSLGRGDTLVMLDDIMTGLKIEKIKEGKSLF